MVVMGRVTAPHGVRGWLRVRAFTEAADGLADYPRWWLGSDATWVPWTVESVEPYRQGLAVKLQGCDDRDAAAALARAEIAVPRSALPRPEADEYYWSDLIGLAVTNIEGEVLGTVKSLIETGANDVLVVSGERERLIPFIAPVVLEVDVAGGRLQVDWAADY
ncbi:MAG TPA: ribosome maturation factor RimM [Burkholderiales bacterium]|nr:ribosome maturation factor RimM [Burkholderiales bacterium]